jgi:hypothetical protein
VEAEHPTEWTRGATEFADRCPRTQRAAHLVYHQLLTRRTRAEAFAAHLLMPGEPGRTCSR